MFTPTFLLLFAAAPSFVHAFTFNFTAPPTQCTNVTVWWTGGTAPFRLLLVPTGALHPEVRIIADYTITSGTNLSFPLQYPGNSTFVAVMSDATGFGSGGTTSGITVTSSLDTSCLRKTQVMPEFLIYTNPSVPQQCTPMMISYNTDAHPPVDVFVVIPGGTSSRIESGSPSNRTFSWTPMVQNGTQLMIVAGDTLGAGKGGSTDILTVAPGNSSCLATQTTNTSASPAPSATHSSDATPGWPL